MKTFLMYLIGTIYIITCPIWAYWTAAGGWLMLFLGVFFILIGKDVEDEIVLEKQEIQNLKNLKAQRMAEQDKPETMKDFLAKVDETT